MKELVILLLLVLESTVGDHSFIFHFFVKGIPAEDQFPSSCKEAPFYLPTSSWIANQRQGSVG
jgi:hypothetical protein